MADPEPIDNVPDTELGRVVKEAADAGATVVVTRNKNGTYKVVATFPD